MMISTTRVTLRPFFRVIEAYSHLISAVSGLPPSEASFTPPVRLGRRLDAIAHERNAVYVCSDGAPPAEVFQPRNQVWVFL
jgi:hypothetical protein